MNNSTTRHTPQQQTGGIEIGIPHRAPLPKAQKKRSVHILCIDDDAGIRGFLTECFKYFNHQVQVAAGGRHGLELFRSATRENQPYDVVITDLGMPDINGQGVARTIKAESPHTPVIMMTGWGSIMGDEEEIALEVDAVVGKPPRMHELNDLILQITAPASLA
jgi:DNA-binding response OmpR family regulator